MVTIIFDFNFYASTEFDIEPKEKDNQTRTSDGCLNDRIRRIPIKIKFFKLFTHHKWWRTLKRSGKILSDFTASLSLISCY